MKLSFPHKVLFSQEQIQGRVKSMAKDINRDYAETELVMVCILKGAAPFFSDLLKHINAPVRVEYMSASSYKGGTKSTGKVNMECKFEKSLKGAHVLVVEDIIDSGLTVGRVYEKLQSQEPYSLTICSLLYKIRDRKISIPYINYNGFDVQKSDFVIGYGMDYRGLYRNLPYIVKLKSKDR